MIKRFAMLPALAGAMFLCALVTAVAQAGQVATVTVKVEGSTKTLLPETEVTTNTENVYKGGKTKDVCPGTSAAGALQLATKGEWEGHWYGGSIKEGKFVGLGYAVESILGESHPLSSTTPWEFWLNGVASETGICSTELKTGDKLLFFPECDSECAPKGTGGGSGTPPATGGGGGEDGSNGSSGSGKSTVLTSPSAVTDTLAVRVTSFLGGHHYRPRHAPRLLAGSIDASSAVTSVELRLRRSYRGRCYAYVATRARFLHARCGRAAFFAVSDGASFSYLLPSSPPAGRYVLEVLAKDAAETTGTSRVAFYVR